MTITKDRRSIFYRFYRLSKDEQFLYYADFSEKSSLEPSFDALKEHSKSLPYTSEREKI
jgi:hypothetical protein